MNEMTSSGAVGSGRLRVYRRWSEADKRRIVGETKEPGVSVSVVARRHDLNTNQLFQWRKKFEKDAGAGFLPIRVVEERAPATAALAPGLITIELVSGIKIRVDNDVDETALMRVVAVMGGGA